MKVISVYWVDSASQPSWVEKRQLRKTPMKCHSVGFLVREDKRSITLALSRSIDAMSADDYCDMMCIPKVAITKRKTLKEFKS